MFSNTTALRLLTVGTVQPLVLLYQPFGLTHLLTTSAIGPDWVYDVVLLENTSFYRISRILFSKFESTAIMATDG